jgi:hypothetical protein
LVAAAPGDARLVYTAAGEGAADGAADDVPVRIKAVETGLSSRGANQMTTFKARAWNGAAGVAVLLWGVAAYGHHSFAPFNMTETITLSGVVKEFQWENPHSWIQIMVTDESGQEVEWSIEANSRASLSRQGWKQSSLKPGDDVTVTSHPLRDGRPGGSLVEVTLADGTRLGE